MKSTALSRSPSFLSLLAAVALGGCSTTSPSPPAPVGPGPSSTTPPATEPRCVGDTKRCGAACVSKRSPEVGCGELACTPCAVAHGSPTCSPEGKCATGTCENGFGNCNGLADDGCEVDVARSDAHCGGCGQACGATRVCRSNTCVDREASAAEAWLATQTEGWCAETYNQIMNLCGDVEFCEDTRVLRDYPAGLGFDVGFDWESLTEKGNIAVIGGDCNAQALTVSVDRPGVLQVGGFMSTTIEVTFKPGKHLLSFQINTSGSALYLDGVRAGSGGAPASTLRLHDKCGPGIVLGQRISYWWEADKRPAWAHHAPFFVQLREGVADVRSYSVTRATSAGQGTVFLFDKTGASGKSWTASVGGLVGIAKNSLDGTAQIDAGASGPLPTWKPLSSCNLK